MMKTATINRKKRAALYARVSTQEQNKGQFPSCESQIEELQSFAESKGWDVAEEITDPGCRAGTLQRPGLTRLRHLVETQQIDVVVCTWYNRLIGSRDFYVLDKEFKSNGVAFVTVHDPADRNTASGRLLESMLVTIKTFENEQISEKVRTKMRQRAEKGLWNGGYTPFGFIRDFEHKAIIPDSTQAKIVEQMYQVYIATNSEFKVRDWLKAHQIPSPTGKTIWPIATVRNILTNRLYIAEIEVNRHNKDNHDVSEVESYRIVKAPFEPFLPVKVFESAQFIRQQKAQASVNRVGRPRSYSQTQCGRVFLLQGVITCGCCGHSMSPWYVHHKPGKNRRKESFINYYICAQQMKNWKQVDHRNLILARKSESWIIDQIREFAESPAVVERVLDKAIANTSKDLQPQRDLLALTQSSLRKNKESINQMFAMMESDKMNDSLLAMLNERATELRAERGRLEEEQRKLSQELAPISAELEPDVFRQKMVTFAEQVEEATPEEMQRLLRLIVRRVDWMPNGEHKVEFHYLPNMTPKNATMQKTSPDMTQD